MAPPAIPNLYTTGAVDPLTDSCDSIPVSGSKIRVLSLVDKCDTQPPEIRINTTAVAQDATSMSLTLATIGGVAAASTDRRTLSKGQRLYFGAAGAPTTRVTISQDTVISSTATTVPIDPAPAAINATDYAVSWCLVSLPTWQSLPITNTDATVDTTEGESYFESQGAMSKSVSSALTYKITDDLLAHKQVLYPASIRSYRNIFAAILRNGFPIVAGACKFINASRDGQIKTASMMSGTLQFQSSIYYPGYRDQMASGSAAATLYDRVMQYAGF